MMMKRIVFGAIAVLLAVACDEAATTSTAAPKDTKAVAEKKKKVAEVEEAKDAGGPPKVEFQEADFSETDRSRDPFRSFARMFAIEAKTRVKSQREVILDQYSLDELKLVGIVTRIFPPRAMLVDPTGKGHVVTRGQFVGRAEIVQGGRGTEYEINWRVDRIRDNDLVVVREDPANPDVPNATRVIPLRPEEETASLEP